MGNPTQGITDVRFTPRELERFWSKVDKTDECWNWLVYKTSAGSTQRYCHECRNRRSRENQRRYRAERRAAR